jgi:hypothetical protein
MLVGLSPLGAAGRGSDTTTNPAFTRAKSSIESAVARAKSPRACVRPRVSRIHSHLQKPAAWITTATGSQANSAAVDDACAGGAATLRLPPWRGRPGHPAREDALAAPSIAAGPSSPVTSTSGKRWTASITSRLTQVRTSSTRSTRLRRGDGFRCHHLRIWGAGFPVLGCVCVRRERASLSDLTDCARARQSPEVHRRRPLVQSEGMARPSLIAGSQHSLGPPPSLLCAGSRASTASGWL